MAVRRKPLSARVITSLRAKAKTKSEYNAYFYTLISKYTEEMAYSSKRQRFLINQGYSYRIITDIPEMSTMELHYGSKEEQLQLLSKVKAASCEKEKGTMKRKSQITRNIKARRRNTPKKK